MDIAEIGISIAGSYDYNTRNMYSKCWQILKDDAKLTFEVCGQAVNTNLFTNRTHGMQRAGMYVSCMTPPVSNKNPSKTMVKVPGYTPEDGLEERLIKEYRAITSEGMDD